jgi:hypothetical protein
LLPYFEVGLDSLEDAVLRLAQAVIQCAKAIPLGAQATVAVETVDVLRKYGLNGIYTIMLRQEFLAAADLLLKALGINPTAFPLSVHELAAASFYALVRFGIIADWLRLSCFLLLISHVYFSIFGCMYMICTGTTSGHERNEPRVRARYASIVVVGR